MSIVSLFALIFPPPFNNAPMLMMFFVMLGTTLMLSKITQSSSFSGIKIKVPASFISTFAPFPTITVCFGLNSSLQTTPVLNAVQCTVAPVSPNHFSIGLSLIECTCSCKSSETSNAVSSVSPSISAQRFF